MREKFSLVRELLKKNKTLVGKKRLSMVGQGDFYGTNNIARSTMNIKHHSQHLTINDPEFPWLFDGKENLNGENSSFYYRTDKRYEVYAVIKKYNEMLHGKSYLALYFLYCREDNSYTLVERKEVEDLTENFGFNYNNDYLDNAQVGEIIPDKTVLYRPTAYDVDMNVSMGVNSRILYGTHPGVQEDAIIISESFSKKMVSNRIESRMIPVHENTILINMYGDENNYRGIPNIGDHITDGIICATRNIKESRMFSDHRDNSLHQPNHASDQIFYGNGEVIDINVYCNNPNIKTNKVNRQLIEYYNDAKVFYSRVWKTCREIQKSGSTNIDIEINHWMSKAQVYLDKDSKWSFNDNLFHNLMVEILIRRKTPICVGDKIVGRAGDKCIVSQIWPDKDMPYVTDKVTIDEFGVRHPVGEKKIVDKIANPLAIVNRTIPMAFFETSITFIIEKMRSYVGTLEDQAEQFKTIITLIEIFNKKQAKEINKLYTKKLTAREQKDFIRSCVDDYLGIEYSAFDDNVNLRDSIIKAYETWPEVLVPYHVFVPKKNEWGRDIHVGEHHIGWQYTYLLKQSGERGFSSRSAGAISDESLPEKSNEKKIGKHPHSDTPIRFGEYESPNFMIMVPPEEFALFSALYRSSVDGRRFLYEAILDDTGDYEIPDKFINRSAEILEVYLKQLGVRIKTIVNDEDYIGHPEDDKEIFEFLIKNRTIMCTQNEMYYLKKLAKTYKRYVKMHQNMIIDFADAWDYVLENLPFKKKKLTKELVEMFKRNLDILTM